MMKRISGRAVLLGRSSLRAGALSALVLAAACSGDDEGRAGYVAPSSAAARDFLAGIDWRALTLERALATFDVTRDGVIDAADTAALQRCVDAKAIVDGLACDIVPDGVVDASDAYALAVALGEQSRASDESVAAVAKALRDNVAGVTKPALGEGVFDWNNDGVSDHADVTALADALVAPPPGLDLDGDGFVSLHDVGLLAERQAAARFSGGAPPTIDLNRDGVSDQKDLALFTELAFYTSEARFGRLDTNADGRIDKRDFCLVSSSPRQASYFDLVMPKAAAEAAFAGAVPTSSLCRADGRRIQRNVTKLGTSLVLEIAPKNLYLNPVTEVPAEYAPIDRSRAEGRQLYVVSTNPSPQPLVALAIPIDPTLAGGDEQVVVRVGGGPLPDNASLVLPTSIAPLANAGGSATKSATLIFQTPPSTSKAAPLPDFAGTDAEHAEAESLVAALVAAKQTYEPLIAGCPCTLIVPEREAAVRYLVHAGTCLDSTLSKAKARLSAAEIEAAELGRWSAYYSSVAAGYHELLAEDYVYMEVVSTLLLVFETGVDFLMGGPGEAFTGALSNLISDQVEWQDTDSAVARGAQDALADVGSGLSVDVGKSVLQGATEAARLGRDRLGKEILDNLKDNLGNPKDAGKGYIKTLIMTALKRIPKDHLRSQQISAAGAEQTAVEHAAEYHERLLEVAYLRASIRVLEQAKDTVKDLRTRLLAKMQEDGCGVTVSTVSPCAFDLETRINEAGRVLAGALAATQSTLDGAAGGGGNSSEQSSCEASSSELSRTELDVATLAHEMTNHVRGGGTKAALDAMAKELGPRVEASFSESSELAKAACFLMLETNAADIDALRDAEEARRQAFDDFEKEVAAALAIYETCGDAGGACSFNPNLEPWAAGARCLGCLPTFQMSCCGDGKVQANEACDPASSASSCPGGQACSSECTCSATACTPEGTASGDPTGTPSPAYGCVSSQVRWFGGNLGTKACITFAGKTFTQIPNGPINRIPADVTPGVYDMTITGPAGSKTIQYTVNEGVAPTVTNTSPSAGPPGTLVTLTGVGLSNAFEGSPPNSYVSFQKLDGSDVENVTIDPVTRTDTTLQFTVPNVPDWTPGLYRIRVLSGPCGTDALVDFTIQ